LNLTAFHPQKLRYFIWLRHGLAEIHSKIWQKVAKKSAREERLNANILLK